MPSLKTIPAADSEAILAAIEQDGACIAEGYLDQDQCRALLDDFDDHLGDMDWGIDDLGYRDEFYGAKTKRLHGLFSKSGGMEGVLVHPLMRELTQKLFIDTSKARDIRLSNAELMVLGSDQGNQVFHTDGASWRRAQKQEDGEILVSVNIALTPFTETNGATRVVPGSHRWEEGREPEDSEVCLATMAQGSALVYSGNVIHSGGANQEDALRIGLYLGYIPSWLRPIENHLVTNAAADIEAMSEPAQMLLDVAPGGFTVYA